jgi:hypothetical protein
VEHERSLEKERVREREKSGDGFFDLKNIYIYIIREDEKIRVEGNLYCKM